MTNLNVLIDPAVTKCQVNDKWYYSYDRKHYEPVMPRFQQIEAFSDGMAAVRYYDCWGYISLDGEIAIPEQYDYCYRFEHGAAVVNKRQKSQMVCRLIDKAGNPLTPWVDCLGSNISEEGYRRIQIDGKWGFADVTGNVVHKPQYDSCLDFTEGLAAVEIDKKWGYINTAGKLVISPVYEIARSFHDGIAMVRRNQEWLHIDKEGFEVMYNVPAKGNDDYSRFSWPSHSMRYDVFCDDDGQYGVKDNEGNCIVAPQFEDAEMLYENIVGVKWNDWWDIIHLK